MYNNRNSYYLYTYFGYHVQVYCGTVSIDWYLYKWDLPSSNHHILSQVLCFGLYILSNIYL